MQPIFEPSKAGFIDDAWTYDGRPLCAAVCIPDRGVRIVSDGISIGKNDSGCLYAVWGNPAQAAQAEAQAIPVGQVVVNLAKAEVLLHSARDGSEIPRCQHLDRRLTLRGRRLDRCSGIGTGVPRCIQCAGCSKKVGARLRGNRWKIPARGFVIPEIEELVFNKCTAQARAGLMSNVLRIERGITVTRVQTSITKEPIGGSVNIVAAALGDRVHHAAHGLAIFSGIIVGDHLELLNGLLRNRAGDPRSSGVLVVEGVGRVIAVCQKSIVAANAAKTKQTERPVRHYSRCQQNEGIDTPPVDRQFQNLPRVHQLGNVGLRVIDQYRFGGDFNARLRTRYDEINVKIDILADRQCDAGRPVRREAALIDADTVPFRRN